MTSLPMATQILSFENFGSLEAHLRMLKSKYNDMIKKYEETLGYILRDTRAVSPKTQKVQEKWALEMQRAMASSAKATAGKVAAKKEEKKPSPSKMFGKGKDKDSEKENESSMEWIALDPMSIFVGPKNKGLAEIYFDTINVLRENINKINLALSICSTLKAKAATAGSASLIVSFVNDVPTKVLLKSADDGKEKKYTMAFSFAVPSTQNMPKVPLKQ